MDDILKEKNALNYDLKEVNGTVYALISWETFKDLIEGMLLVSPQTKLGELRTIDGHPLRLLKPNSKN